MDIYSNKHNWKIFLGIIGFIILLITSFYSNYLANKLAEKESKSAYYFSLALDNIQNEQDLQKEISPLEDTIIFSNKIPIILEGEDGYLQGFNFRNDIESDQDYLKNEISKLLNRGFVPLDGSGYHKKIYYKNSRLYTVIKFFPIVQILLIGAFVALGYFLFNTSRRAEQNRVWAGMAKETAHQLGTPISAILAWIEFLKESAKEDVKQSEIISELQKDVDRLELIADRFSKIGSAPKLEKVNLIDELNMCKNYMQKRASSKIDFEFPSIETNPIYANVNSHLFEWVVENLLRNSLDAMGGTGTISARVQKDGDFVEIDISDTGKGIPANKLKTVFQPGYTTKQRGWGLGLSLAKRIIENYHKGKIFVKNSKLNEGTTFTIKLPAV